ncbi:haloacid dehalogenase type II [Hydrogenophaga sp.]|uniref:haloacid dehalogenase type II n=1 Tax=Hydrogenophaga sp. TaxID=1904254 RepID=UPI00286E6849|nr:haloacid dehalogenase type II [Hydrogenophaga sp.]
MNSVPRILVFDIFGTVVDWHGSIVREVSARWPQADADAFALAWRAGYQPAMEAVRSGGRGFVKLDVLHREILDGLLPRFGLGQLGDAERAELNRVWHRLAAWPDSVAGLTRLKARCTICSLSNGNLGLLTDMAKHAGLPWDCVLSAEVFRAYKPDPRVYRGAAEVFDAERGEVLMVAAHHDDLAAARACGLQTAYVERPMEFGAAHPKDVSPQPGNTWHARNLLHLAEQLGC